VSRDWGLYWDDILVACRKVMRYISGLDKDTFLRDERTYDAVLRNLEVIGEASKAFLTTSAHDCPGSSGERSPDCETSSPTTTLAWTLRFCGLS
jgi:hypothetical protein